VACAACGPLAAGYDLEAGTLPDEHAATAEQDLLAAERHAALREALGDLPPGCQRLIALLTADPPLPYAEISARLGIPVGSIGPTRRRCLDKLRRHPAIAALITAEADSAHDQMPGQAGTRPAAPQAGPAAGASDVRSARDRGHAGWPPGTNPSPGSRVRPDYPHRPGQAP